MGRDEVTMGIDGLPRDSIDLILDDTTRYIREARELRGEEAHLVVSRAVHKLTAEARHTRAESIADAAMILALAGALISVVVAVLGIVVSGVSP